MNKVIKIKNSFKGSIYFILGSFLDRNVKRFAYKFLKNKIFGIFIEKDPSS